MRYLEENILEMKLFDVTQAQDPLGKNNFQGNMT